MGKEIKSVSIDEGLAEAIDEADDLNLSGLVNEMLRAYFTTGDTHRSAIRSRLEQVEEEIEETEEELNELRNEKERLEQLLEKEEAEMEPLREQAVELFSGRDVDVTNPAVEQWAMKLDMPPQELLEKVEEWAD